MIYTINGEQPFQVLSDSFSVSPSQSGYDLYLSADGFNYSRFATVASGTTKQFTGMNNGNYYILSGNTSEVKVNWERECGGGGGGAAGVSSLDGQTGALTTKTIGGESILGTGDIPVGGSDNYQIVNNISEVQNPQTGTRVYVHSGSTVETYDGIAFDASTVSEGYVVKVFDGQGNKYFDIYRSGDNFFWNWENDGDIHSRTANGKLFYYKSDTTNHIFYLFPADTATTLDLQEMGEGVTTASTSTGVTVTWGAQSLMYDGAEYVPTSDIIYDLDSMTQSEIAALNAYLNSASEAERVGAHIYKNKIKCRYGNIESGKIRFYSHYIENDSGFAFIRNYIFFIKPDGTFEYLENGKEYGIPATFAVNYSTHTLTSTNTPMWAASRGITKGVAPVVYLLSGSTGVAVAKDAYIEKTGDWNGIIGATFEYSGETINAKWSYDQDTATLISWSTGGSGGPTIVNLDALSQAELTALYEQLSGETTASTVNEDYIFLKEFSSVHGGNKIPLRVQYMGYYSYKIRFGVCKPDNGHAGEIWLLTVDVEDNGNMSASLNPNYSFPGFSKFNVIDRYEWVKFDFSTSAITTSDGSQTIYTGDTGSGAWVFDFDKKKDFYRDTYVPCYKFKIADATFNDRTFASPTVSYEELATPVSLSCADGATRPFGYVFYFDYGYFTVSMYVDGDQNRYARFTVTKN